jgi:hypothetical protein
MRTLKFGIASLSLALLSLSSCIDHEVIPAPTSSVSLTCNFNGTINSTDVELSKNVNGYYCYQSKAKLLLPPPDLSSATYYAAMVSNQTPVMVQIGIGSVLWDQSTTTDPTLSIFKSFFLTNLTPAYSNLGAAGFEVTYRDVNGTIWKSDALSPNTQNVQFSQIKQESDATGDYSKFVCDFNCYVYHIDSTDTANPVLESLKFENAKFQGWFKR